MDTGGYVITAVIIGGICAIFGGLIGRNKDRWGMGVTLGFLLGPIGLIIVAVMSPGPNARFLPSRGSVVMVPSTTGSPDTRPRVPCPQCAEMVLVDANVCRFCGAQFPKSAESP